MARRSGVDTGTAELSGRSNHPELLFSFLSGEKERFMTEQEHQIVPTLFRDVGGEYGYIWIHP